MSISKQYFSEKLIDGYVKAPTSLKEQAITNLAIQLCQSVEMKEHICGRCLNKYYYCSYTEWENLIQKRVTSICEKLFLPPALKNPLVGRIRSIARQMLSWNTQVMFIPSFPFTDHLLILSDWTVEGRLNEKKVAERLIHDKKLPAFIRYQLACLHCLEPFLLPLWNKVSLEHQRHFCAFEESKLVKMWSCKLSKQELFQSEEDFCTEGFRVAVREGMRAAVIYFWDVLSDTAKRDVMLDTATHLMLQQYEDFDMISMIVMMKGKNWMALPENYTDILYFLFCQMTREQQVVFLQNSIELNIVECFLHSPYQETFVAILKKFWSILSESESKYGEILLQITYRYSNQTNNNINNIKMDYYDYGSLLIELFRQTPNLYKWYTFEGTKLNIQNSEVIAGIGVKILLEMIRRRPLKHRNKLVFQSILRQATVEEKKLIIHSKHGEEICKYIALSENWELLNWTLKQFLPEDDIFPFRRQFLLSNTGVSVCFRMLIQVSEEPMSFLVQWASLSKEDISEIKSRILRRDFQHELLSVLRDDSSQRIQLDLLECVMRRFLSEDAREQFKKQFVEKNAMRLCIDFIRNSAWEEATRFLNWCFPATEDIVLFKRKLFDNEGMSVQISNVRQGKLRDAELFIQWFRLYPEDIKNLKKKILFSRAIKDEIFTILTFGGREQKTVALYLRWGFDDDETLMAFKNSFQNYRYFRLYGEEKRKLILQRSDELIKERLWDLEREKQHRTQEIQKQELVKKLPK